MDDFADENGTKLGRFGDTGYVLPPQSDIVPKILVLLYTVLRDGMPTGLQILSFPDARLAFSDAIERVNLAFDTLCALAGLAYKASSSSLKSATSTVMDLFDFLFKDLGSLVSDGIMLRSSSLQSARGDEKDLETAGTGLGSALTTLDACVVGRLTGIRTAMAISAATRNAAL